MCIRVPSPHSKIGARSKDPTFLRSKGRRPGDSVKCTGTIVDVPIGEELFQPQIVQSQVLLQGSILYVIPAA